LFIALGTAPEGASLQASRGPTKESACAVPEVSRSISPETPSVAFGSTKLLLLWLGY
jgi:hypothetical protein